MAAIELPRISVVAHIIVHAAFPVRIGLPAEAEIQSIRIVGGLDAELDQRVLAGDGAGLKGAAGHSLFGQAFPVVLVAGDAGPPLVDNRTEFACALVRAH